MNVNVKTRKKLETPYIALWRPDLNEQNYFERLVLFRNGVIMLSLTHFSPENHRFSDVFRGYRNVTLD